MAILRPIAMFQIYSGYITSWDELTGGIYEAWTTFDTTGPDNLDLVTNGNDNGASGVPSMAMGLGDTVHMVGTISYSAGAGKIYVCLGAFDDDVDSGGQLQSKQALTALTEGAFDVTLTVTDAATYISPFIYNDDGTPSGSISFTSIVYTEA